MCYKYKEIPKIPGDIIAWCKNELRKAMQFDPVAYHMYHISVSKDIIFESKEFYMLLAYTALKMKSEVEQEYLDYMQKVVKPIRFIKPGGIQT